MKYKMENEKLQIASCSIEDLTLKQAQLFMDQWNDNSSLGTLTLFYERDSGLLVLNRNNEHFHDYLDIAEGYLSADKQERIKIRQNTPSSMKETMDVLETCIQDRIFNKWILMAINNKIEPAGRKSVERVIDKYDPYIASFIAFKMGVIRGKRAERARKKH